MVSHMFVAPWNVPLATLLSAVVAYLLGCFNGSVIISKYVLHDDIRGHGSGNAGLTNFHRVFGGKLTLVVLLCDVLKAVVTILIAVALFRWDFTRRMIASGALDLASAEELRSTAAWQCDPVAKYWAGLFCLLGHMFPCMFGFKGGKGILSGGAVAIMIGLGGGGQLPAWLIPVTVWGGFLLLTALTRWVSLGSCWAGASFPVITWLVYPYDTLLLLLAILIGGLILWKHRENIKRLLNGTESKLTFHKKKD